MPDGYGPDPFQKNMFWHEAQQGPTAQDLQTMTAPFGGSPEQVMALLQSPEVQHHLQQYGLGGFNPSQVRQSPFLPNQFMHQHPLMGGIMNNAMANAAATPEAPMVSGAGSGISRAMQGMMGGPELLRQYQVRQMMAPFQAMGMQLPVRAEERRQSLLQSLQEDMEMRRQHEMQKTPAENIRNEIYAPPGSPGYFTEGRDQNVGGLTAQQAGMGGTHPLFNLMPSAQMPQGAQLKSDGQPQYHPYDPSQVAAYEGARNPQKGAQAKLAGARAEEQTQETDEGMPSAKVGAEQRKGQPKAGGGKDEAYWRKQYQDMDDKISTQIRAYEAAITDPKASEEQKNLYRMQIDQLNAQREQEKAKIDEARGAAGASQPYQPAPRYNPGGPAGGMNPGAKPNQAGPQSQGQQQTQPQSQGTTPYNW